MRLLTGARITVIVLLIGCALLGVFAGSQRSMRASMTPRNVSVVFAENSADNVGDNATPDNATPDNAAPDNATPDNATPDNATPDNGADNGSDNGADNGSPGSDNSTGGGDNSPAGCTASPGPSTRMVLVIGNLEAKNAGIMVTYTASVPEASQAVTELLELPWTTSTRLILERTTEEAERVMQATCGVRFANRVDVLTLGTLSYARASTLR